MATSEGSIPIRRPGATVKAFSSVTEQRLEWLWPGRIPLGKLSVIAGDPGLGKSLVTIAIAAAVTSESKWPDCQECAPRGGVIMLSAEDDDADTVKPRLRIAGADLDNVYSLDSIVCNPDGSRRGLSLDLDADKLRDAIARVPYCRLVVIDPISAFLGSVDSHKNADVRGLLSVLSQIAQTTRVAIVYVSHLNKGAGGPMARITGSGAFVAAARSGMIVARDTEDPDRRLIFMPKCNLSRETQGVAYRIRQDENEDLPVIQWESGFIPVNGDVLLDGGDAHDRGIRRDAKEWLALELHGGPQLVTDLRRSSQQAGHAWRTVERAKQEMGIAARRDGVSRKWRWEMDE